MISNIKNTFLYFIKTFGCQMNVNDSEIISGQMNNMGYKMTSDINQADIIILNTCCVRKKVEDKIYSMAGTINQIKKEKPELIFAICGCLAQKEKNNIQRRIPAVDIIFGPSQASSINKILESFLIDKEKRSIIYCNNREQFSLQNIFINNNRHSTSAFVQIMKGCNNFCSYCIVPCTRGPEESRPIEEILNEIKKLADYNFKEIFLLGQNVNSYGNGWKNPYNFLSLLSKIKEISGIKRIRFTTSHPKDFNLDLIKVIKSSDKICEHIHLPIQSGSDNVLKKMNRKYDMNHYYYIIKNIRKYMPDASITTDVMVGFPGETEKDFEKTLEAFNNIQFDSSYSFIYSNREGTLASLFKEQIPLVIKKKRLWRLMDLQKIISIKKNQNTVGKIVEILVENKSKKGIKNQYWGRTRTNKVVVFGDKGNSRINNNNPGLLGHFVDVKILQADAYTLYGEMVNDQDK